MIGYTIVEIIAGLAALMFLGKAIKSDATRNDIATGILLCLVFMLLILGIEEVLR